MASSLILEIYLEDFVAVIRDINVCDRRHLLTIPSTTIFWTSVHRDSSLKSAPKILKRIELLKVVTSHIK